MKSLFFFLLTLCSVAHAQDSLMIDKLANRPGKDSLTGLTLPDFEWRDLDGKIFRKADLQGKVAFINFWFVGCPPCMGEIPDINKVTSQFNDSIVVISLALNDSTLLRKFMAGKASKAPEPILFPIIPKSDSICEQFGIDGYPTTLFIDKKGVVRLVQSGAGVSAIKNYVAIYGTKSLTRGWKKIAKQVEHMESKSIYEEYALLIRELLTEPTN